ncbi:unnamed protein product [Nezara viridula]|uniref:Uncharacterized protein n=1 Tax=Nezara viridula TaxID=85310 RepID=A0A9P0HNJ2_NEZVI|nr:unnamed protein product [Nezara viridula]
MPRSKKQNRRAYALLVERIRCLIHTALAYRMTPLNGTDREGRSTRDRQDGRKWYLTSLPRKRKCGHDLEDWTGPGNLPLQALNLPRCPRLQDVLQGFSLRPCCYIHIHSRPLVSCESSKQGFVSVRLLLGGTFPTQIGSFFSQPLNPTVLL